MAKATKTLRTERVEVVDSGGPVPSPRRGREFGRLKHEWALLTLRVRRIGRARLHADLTILGRLLVALDLERDAGETHASPAAA